MPRTVPPAFADRLRDGAAVLTELILINANFGPPLALTRYPHDVTMGGVVYRSRPGMNMSKIEATLELAAGNATGSTMIDDILVTTPDVLSSRFDRAKFTHMLVDAEDPTCGTGTPQPVILMTGRVGGVQVAGRVVQVELRSLTALLDTVVGAVTSPSCRVRRLGDEICKKDLSGVGPKGQPFRVGGITVTAILGDASFNAAVTATIVDDDWFLNGYCTWTSGPNAGQEIEISGHKVAGSYFQLFAAPGMPIAVGDTLSAEAGCSRTMSACDTKFSNRWNFDGESYIVGDTDLLQGAEGKAGL